MCWREAEGEESDSRKMWVEKLMSKNDEVMLSLKGCAILKVGIWAHRHYARSGHRTYLQQSLLWVPHCRPLKGFNIMGSKHGMLGGPLRVIISAPIQAEHFHRASHSLGIFHVSLASALSTAAERYRSNFLLSWTQFLCSSLGWNFLHNCLPERCSFTV